jgi:hypothetical protein
MLRSEAAPAFIARKTNRIVARLTALSSKHFGYEQPHLLAVETVANAVGWLQISGYLIIKDRRLGR